MLNDTGSRRAKCERGGGGGGGSPCVWPNMRAGGGGEGPPCVWPNIRARDPCVSPHASGVKVPPSHGAIQFILRYSTLHIYLVHILKKKNVQSQKGGSSEPPPPPPCVRPCDIRFISDEDWDRRTSSILKNVHVHAHKRVSKPLNIRRMAGTPDPGHFGLHAILAVNTNQYTPDVHTKKHTSKKRTNITFTQRKAQILLNLLSKFCK